MLADFALANEMDDPYELMYEYSHLSSGRDRSPSTITNERENDHVEHLENAKIFEHISDKKRVAKNAVESVFAKLLIQSRRENNCQYINRRCKQIRNDIQDHFTVDQIGEAWFYRSQVVPDFKIIARRILLAFIEGNPRKRYVVLQGDFKTGKTSFANAFCTLFSKENNII
ncbi:large T antigen [Caerostris darwini]|uniref:Large T antigen n=1 Tax=Caerostris darwini TaxID=1538125 RepID=A0AAV4RHX3_9ARAC|nr:large T antigen [Caerostris darwini]